MQARKVFLRLATVLLLSGCLSPVDIPVDNIGDKLVVFGQVSTIPDQNFIQLGRTASTDRLPVPLSGATVQLYDDAGNFHNYSEDTFNPGRYLLQNFSGIGTSSYHIQIVTPEGSTYVSESERMPASAGEVTARYDFIREEYTDAEGIVTLQPFMKIYVNASVNELSFVKWSTEEAFLLSPTDFPDPFGSVPPPCFVVQNADPQRIALFNGEEVKADLIDNLLIGSRLVDWSFIEKHYFTIYQSSLTKEAYEYWRKVDILANQVGSIFDTPPAEITGNIRNVNDVSEKVYGYFQASNQVFNRIYLLKSDLPFPLTARDCVFDNRNSQDYQSRCLDCLSVRNSSHRRPDWF